MQCNYSKHISESNFCQFFVYYLLCLCESMVSSAKEDNVITQRILSSLMCKYNVKMWKSWLWYHCQCQISVCPFKKQVNLFKSGKMSKSIRENNNLPHQQTIFKTRLKHICCSPSLPSFHPTPTCVQNNPKNQLVFFSLQKSINVIITIYGWKFERHGFEIPYRFKLTHNNTMWKYENIGLDITVRSLPVHSRNKWICSKVVKCENLYVKITTCLISKLFSKLDKRIHCFPS